MQWFVWFCWDDMTRDSTYLRTSPIGGVQKQREMTPTHWDRCPGVPLASALVSRPTSRRFPYAVSESLFNRCLHLERALRRRYW